MPKGFSADSHRGVGLARGHTACRSPPRQDTNGRHVPPPVSECRGIRPPSRLPSCPRHVLCAGEGRTEPRATGTWPGWNSHRQFLERHEVSPASSPEAPLRMGAVGPAVRRRLHKAASQACGGDETSHHRPRRPSPGQVVVLWPTAGLLQMEGAPCRGPDLLGGLARGHACLRASWLRPSTDPH